MNGPHLNRDDAIRRAVGIPTSEETQKEMEQKDLYEAMIAVRLAILKLTLEIDSNTEATVALVEEMREQREMREAQHKTLTMGTGQVFIAKPENMKTPE